LPLARVEAVYRVNYKDSKCTDILSMMIDYFRCVVYTKSITKSLFGHWWWHIDTGLWSMVTSEENELRKKCLPWRGGVVDVLRTIDDKPRFPSALNFSVVRALKDKENWNYSEMGTRLDPQTLSDKPWPQIRYTYQANSYMNSFLVDVLLHWFKIWFSLVLAQILFSEFEIMMMMADAMGLEKPCA
jgi:hypothetical protein